MFKAIRVVVLLFVLMIVAISSWQAQVRSTDWSRTLWVKLYPMNADGSQVSADYIERLDPAAFDGIQSFFQREVERFGRDGREPVRIDLGRELTQHPPSSAGLKSALDVIWWSLKMRWWIWREVSEHDEYRPDVRIFIRYHEATSQLPLDSSLGVRKGLYGIVNAFADRRMQGSNNVVIAHELMHTLGATDKYDLGSGQPLVPDGLAEPDREPLFPQRKAEIMGGRIAVGRDQAQVPDNLRAVVVGPVTAREIRLIE